ncbi:MAG: cation diffusion facilitator family transporter [Candidatus Nanopelagicales bacterium]
MPDLGPGTTGSQMEQQALLISIVATAATGALAIVWGLVAGSQIILFDGAYASLGMLLSWLSLRASKLVAAGPTKNYPFGREALAPLVIMVQGIALLATCAYAIVSSSLSLLHGGSEVEAGSVVLYGVISTIAAVAVFFRMRGYGKRSELVKAEATQWMASAGLSVGMLVAFTAVLALSGTRFENAAAYLDPILVILACLAFFPAPLAMVRDTVRELLEGAPPESVQKPVKQIVNRVSVAEGLPEPVVRMAKLGNKLYLELDYLVDNGDFDTADVDHIRHAMEDAVAELPYAIWLNVDLSTDASWAEAEVVQAGPSPA